MSFGYDLDPGPAATSTCGSPPARPSPWSARPAPASPRSPSSIARFYDPAAGAGADRRPRPARGLDPARCATSSRSCPRRATCSPARIAENLAFGRPDATDEEIRAAADAVGATEFIEALPDGFDTRHQRPRLGALGRPAPADLLRPRPGRRPAPADPRRGHLLGRPAHGAAHRGGARHGCSRGAPRSSSPTASPPSATPTGSSCWRTGRIVEQGTHDELLEAGGRYAELYDDWASATA